MSTAEPRVDAYIAHAAAFAQPMLREIRQRVPTPWLVRPRPRHTSSVSAPATTVSIWNG